MKESMTSRGFRIVQFEDSYGQICSLQESSSVEPHLWLGVENTGQLLNGPGGQVSEQIDARMHIDTETAIAIRAELDAFIGDRTEETKRDDDRARRIRELVWKWVGKPAYFEENLIVFKTEFLPELFAQAAELIDAIDDAEIPAKKVGE